MEMTRRSLFALVGAVPVLGKLPTVAQTRTLAAVEWACYLPEGSLIMSRSLNAARIDIYGCEIFQFGHRAYRGLPPGDFFWVPAGGVVACGRHPDSMFVHTRLPEWPHTHVDQLPHR
jgi:hypothetical protein